MLSCILARLHSFCIVKAAQQPDATGVFPLWIAYNTEASSVVKDRVWEAWPGVAAAEGTLAEAIKEDWGNAAVLRIVETAPEACGRY